MHPFWRAKLTSETKSSLRSPQREYTYGGAVRKVIVYVLAGSFYNLHFHTWCSLVKPAEFKHITKRRNGKQL
ncbi:MAG: hypothetical protein GY880_28040 [Planctomycetaceae bacterium]|nr:hypothetical protein [Planctomycetaceae bacterium]